MKESDSHKTSEGSFLGDVFALIGDYLVGLVFLGYFGVCFWFFDLFHISNPDTQLAWVLAPVFIGGFWLARRMIRKSWGE